VTFGLHKRQRIFWIAERSVVGHLCRILYPLLDLEVRKRIVGRKAKWITLTTCRRRCRVTSVGLFHLSYQCLLQCECLGGRRWTLGRRLRSSRASCKLVPGTAGFGAVQCSPVRKKCLKAEVYLKNFFLTGDILRFKERLTDSRLVPWCSFGVGYNSVERFASVFCIYMCRGSVVGIATCYELDVTGIESRWGRDCPLPTRSNLGPT
jgi:hypothetical protein